MRTSAALLLLILVAAVAVGAEPEHADAAAEHHGGWLQAVAPFINFAVLVGVLIYFLKKPMSLFLAQRREGFVTMMKEAEAARDAAVARMNELQERLKSLDQDLETIRRNADLEAQAERARLLEEAREEARRIIVEAEKEIANRYTLAVRELKEQVVTEAVSQAETIVKERLDPVSHDALVDTYLDTLSKSR